MRFGVGGVGAGPGFISPVKNRGLNKSGERFSVVQEQTNTREQLSRAVTAAVQQMLAGQAASSAGKTAIANFTRDSDLVEMSRGTYSKERSKEITRDRDELEQNKTSKKDKISAAMAAPSKKNDKKIKKLNADVDQINTKLQALASRASGVARMAKDEMRELLLFLPKKASNPKSLSKTESEILSCFMNSQLALQKQIHDMIAEHQKEMQGQLLARAAKKAELERMTRELAEEENTLRMKIQEQAVMTRQRKEQIGNQASKVRLHMYYVMKIRILLRLSLIHI